MKPPANPEKYRAVLHHNREKLPSEPKKHAAVITTPERIREIFAVIKSENPTFDSASQKNVEAVINFLWENDAVGGFAIDNVRVAVAALSYPEEKLERVPIPSPPPRPPPPAPTEPEEVLQPGQLSLKCSKSELEHATKEQIKDWLERARKAGMK